VLVATLCIHWRIPDALLSCHRYGEIQAPVQSNLATCQIQRSAAARRFRSSKQAVRCGLSVIRPESRIDPTESSINTMRSMRSNASNIRVSYEKVPSLQAAIQFRLNSVRPVGTRRITSEAVASASMIPW
jgi:hypothetical protein